MGAAKGSGCATSGTAGRAYADAHRREVVACVAGALEDRVVAVQDRAWRDVACSVVRLDKPGDGGQTEDSDSTLVREPPRDHPPEGVPDHGERLGAEVLLDLGQDALGHVLRARGGRVVHGLRPGQVDVHAAPGHVAHHGLERQHDPVVHPEAVQHDEGATRPFDSSDHATTVALSPDGSRPRGAATGRRVTR